MCCHLFSLNPYIQRAFCGGFRFWLCILGDFQKYCSTVLCCKNIVEILPKILLNGYKYCQKLPKILLNSYIQQLLQQTLDTCAGSECNQKWTFQCHQEEGASSTINWHQPVLDPVDGDVVAEDRVDDLVQLVRVVDRRVEGEFLQQYIQPHNICMQFVLERFCLLCFHLAKLDYLALGTLSLDIVLPEISLFLWARPTSFFLVNLDKI